MASPIMCKRGFPSMYIMSTIMQKLNTESLSDCSVNLNRPGDFPSF
jgi:hypothetical protein